MGLGWDAFRDALRGERLPAGLVDLDAVARNAAVLAARVAPGKRLRVASKSIRHVGLLRRILALGPGQFVGVMCFTVDEACFLADRGFDDLLVAYPTLQAAALRSLARRAAAGTTVSVVVDAAEQVEAMAAAARSEGTALRAVIELDVAYRPFGGAVHLGARRSPIRTAAQAVALARVIRDTDGVGLAGLMAYEAHVAGVQDANPFAKAMNPGKRAMKRLAVPAVRALRAEVVAALRADGHEVGLVNGGGTGSLDSTTAEAVVTEATAGSGFLASHLFGYFAGLPLEPALFFALEAVRHSDPGYVTCSGGGYVASGEPGWDKVPVPHLPPGLALLGMEACGEVQTPLRLGPETPPIRLGDPVIFRPAKAGEPAERFAEYLLLEGGRVVAREPTYRGEGACFL